MLEYEMNTGKGNGTKKIYNKIIKRNSQKSQKHIE